MKMIIKVMVLSFVLLLTGCCGLFESKTCGIKNSQWAQMSAAEQFDIEKSYHEKQRIAEQLKANKLALKQQKKLAQIRKDNEKAQMKRMKEEQELLEKQQNKIAAELELKQKAYAPAETIQ